MTRDKNTTISIEQALENLERESVSSHVIENAQQRVWNHLAHSIQEEQKQPQKSSSWLSLFSFGQRSRALFFSLFAVFLTISSSGVAWKIAQDNKKPVNIAQDSTSEDKDPDLRSLAAAKFELLNGGITFEEYQNATGGTDAAPRGDAAIANAENAQKIRDLANKASADKSPIYYNEVEVLMPTREDFGILSGQVSSSQNSTKKHPLVDYTKPLTMKTWTSANYSKYLVGQGDKIITLNIHTPEFALDYEGGKYAVYSEYKGERYLSGLTAEERQNPDLQFVKYILEGNPNIKKTGSTEIDGRKLTVFEENLTAQNTKDIVLDSNAKSQATKSRYFVDLDKFQVYMQEIYKNDTLIQSIKNKASIQYGAENIKLVTTYTELGSIETKKITRELNISNTKERKISEVNTKYPLVYSPDLSLSFYASIFQVDESQNQYELLTQTTDFNPYYERTNTTPVSNIQANYSQSTSLSGEIYKTEPVSNIANKGVSSSQVTVYLDGNPVNAKLVIVTPEAVKDSNKEDANAPKTLVAPSPYNSRHIIFKSPSGLWYRIGDMVTATNESKSIIQANMKLMTLTNDKALEVDTRNEQKQNATPRFEPTSFDKIDPSLRYLPGNLEKTYGIKAVSLNKPTRKASDSTCEKYEDIVIADCLIEKYEGFRMGFTAESKDTPLKSPDGSSSGSASSYVAFVDYFVLNAPLNIVKPRLDKIQSSGGSLVYKEFGGKTVVINGYIEKDKAQQILNNVKKDADMSILAEQLKSSNRIHGLNINPESSNSTIKK